MKIDIEGFEFEALKGAQKLLRKKVFEHILIEVHPEALKGMLQSESDIDLLMTKNTYQKKKISSILNLYSLK
jgi:hypothetical protein